MGLITLFLVLIVVANGCATPQTVVKINGMQMAPEVELQSHPTTRLSLTYSYYRVFKQKIKSRGYEEEVIDTEPLKTTGILKLPANTEAVGIMIYIDNPELRKYKVVVTEARKGEEKETVIYQGIRPDNIIRHIYLSRDLTGLTVGAKVVLQDQNDTLQLKGVMVTTVAK